MSAEAGIMESLHAHSAKMAAGELVPQAVRDMVVGQMGLVLCQMHEGRIDAAEFRAMATEAARTAVETHAAACASGQGQGKAGRAAAVAAALRPVAWPLAAIVIGLAVIVAAFPAARPLMAAAARAVIAP